MLPMVLPLSSEKPYPAVKCGNCLYPPLQELHVLFKFARSFDAAEYKSRTQSIAQLRKDTQLLR